MTTLGRSPPNPAYNRAAGSYTEEDFTVPISQSSLGANDAKRAVTTNSTNGPSAAKEVTCRWCPLSGPPAWIVSHEPTCRGRCTETPSPDEVQQDN